MSERLCTELSPKKPTGTNFTFSPNLHADYKWLSNGVAKECFSFESDYSNSDYRESGSERERDIMQKVYIIMFGTSILGSG